MEPAFEPRVNEARRISGVNGEERALLARWNLSFREKSGTGHFCAGANQGGTAEAFRSLLWDEGLFLFG